MIVGIDPGKTGAIAVLSDSGLLVDVWDMPTVGTDKAAQVDPAEVWRLISQAGWGRERVEMVVVEQVAAFPKNGSIGNFKLGYAYGIIIGVVGALRLPYVTVRPADWKRAMRCSSDKDMSRQRFEERWPMSGELVRRKKDADRAEAALLAAWHVDKQRQMFGGAA